MSDDAGKTWSAPVIVDDEGAANIDRQNIYPAVCFTKEGMLVMWSTHGADPKGSFAGQYDANTGGGKRAILAMPAKASPNAAANPLQLAPPDESTTLVSRDHSEQSVTPPPLPADQKAMDRRDAGLLAGVQIEHPAVKFVPAPLRPLAEAPCADQSLLLGRSQYQAPEFGYGEPAAHYEPVEDGGFRIVGGMRRFNRLIVQGQNRIKTGDLPIFRMGTAGGVGVYTNFVKGDEKIFPLWARADAQCGGVWPSMGTLRIGIRTVTGGTAWLDETPGLGITTTFRPGYTDYQITSPDWKASVRIAPALDSHGFVCRISFDRPIPIVWRFGGMFWKYEDAQPNQNRVRIDGNRALISEPNLPNGLVLAGWDGDGVGQVVPAALEQDSAFEDAMRGESQPVLANHGEEAEFVAKRPQSVYHVAAFWGVTEYDEPRSRVSMARFDTANTSAWPKESERLKQAWFDAHIGRALEPESHFARLLANPSKELDRTCESWDARRAEFRIQTPDRHLNALVNWERCRSAYHQQGPGLVLSAGRWEIYAHLSVGWYGKEWSGDHSSIAGLLRFHGAMHERDGAIGWIAPSLGTFMNENNTPYWVDLRSGATTPGRAIASSCVICGQPWSGRSPTSD